MLSLRVIRPDDFPKRTSLIHFDKTKLGRVSKYTLEIFLKRGELVHGDRYDYSSITHEHIMGVKSHIPITCKECGYNWCPTIDKHINARQGCPSCAGNAPWTYENFLSSAIKIHGQKFNYSQIIPNMISGKDSYMYIICNTCNYNWSVTIHNHVNNKNGCPNCSGHMRDSNLNQLKSMVINIIILW